MDKVLIVDNDVEVLKTLKAGLDKIRQFNVFTATDADEAISILSAHRIAVLATDVETTDFDSMDLLAYMTQKYPNTPCIVMTEHGKPWFRQRIRQQAFLYHMEKPIDVGKLTSSIVVGLNLRDEGTNIEGMTMTSLLPLIELQQKTCCMQVATTGGREGMLYFKDGELLDAHCGELEGDAAAREISTWKRISFELSDLPNYSILKQVKTTLMDIAGASWDKVEATAASGPADGIITLEETVEKPKPETAAAPAKEAAITLSEVVSAPDTRTSGPRKAETANKIMDNLLMDIKHAKGYNAVAMLDNNGEILAADQLEDSLDLEKLSGEMMRFYNNAQATAKNLDAETTEAFTLHTSNGIILMQQLSEPQASDENICAMISCPPRANWYYFKVRLDNLAARL